MLRACYRVLKPGGLISFLVIAAAEGLSDDLARAAVAAGPDHVVTEPSYSALMESAGFDAVKVTDVTDAYVTTLADWIREWNSESMELKGLIGASEFSERQTHRQGALEAAGREILGRYLISGGRPL